MNGIFYCYHLFFPFVCFILVLFFIVPLHSIYTLFYYEFIVPLFPAIVKHAESIAWSPRNPLELCKVVQLLQPVQLVHLLHPVQSLQFQHLVQLLQPVHLEHL